MLKQRQVRRSNQGHEFKTAIKAYLGALVMNNLNVYVGCELDVAGQKVTFESVKYTDGPKEGQPKTAINKIKT